MTSRYYNLKDILFPREICESIDNFRDEFKKDSLKLYDYDQVIESFIELRDSSHLKDRIEYLQDDVSDLEAQVSDLETDKEDLKNKLDSVKEDMFIMRERFERLINHIDKSSHGNNEIHDLLNNELKWLNTFK